MGETIGGEHGKDDKSGLSTFSGVFVPCILSIFGVILFERLGYVVGQAGLLLAILILVLGYLVVSITTLSLSAIATNGNMKGGGAYYMISRSLGPAFGGSIGVIFYCANIAAGGTYVLGFCEAVVEMLNSQALVVISESSMWLEYKGEIVYGSAAFFILFLICIIGAGAYAKAALIIFIILWFSIICAIGSFAFGSPDPEIGFTGWSKDSLEGNLYPDYQGESFQSIFAIFFPAVTGIMAGANMSGDLKDPGRSIPRGTLMAIGISSVVYFSLLILVASTVGELPDGNRALIENEFIIQNVCFWWPIISVGIYASSLSSALGSLIGASRILQALGKDNLIPFLDFFAKGSGAEDEPRRAVVISYLLIQACVFVPNLNIMATVTSMFFLLSYGVVNFACFSLRIVGSPNFRPTFKYFNLWLSLAGAVMCIGGMFYVEPMYAAVSLLLMISLYLFIMWRAVSVDWGDISQAMMYHQVRKYLLKMDVRREHIKYWRPQILLIVNNPAEDTNLIQFTNNLKKGGLYVLGTVIPGGDYTQLGQLSLRFNEAWVDYISSMSLKAFSETTIAPDVRTGVHTLIMGSGIGVMKPNTIILGFYNESDVLSDSGSGISMSEQQIFSIQKANEIFGDVVEENQGRMQKYGMNPDQYLDAVREALYFNKNVIISRNFASMDKDMIMAYRGSRFRNHRQRMTVDMWPIIPSSNADYDSSLTLTLLLGYILKQTDIWTVYSKLRVKGIVNTPADKYAEEQRLQALLTRSRITSRIEVFDITTSSSRTYHEMVQSGELAADCSNINSIPSKRRYAIYHEIIESQSALTCAIFMTMPNVDSEESAETFVEGLDVLTKGLPPVMLVHGAEQVITNEI